jgi:hypothetical protein
MRISAWCCVVAGVLIAVLGVAYVPIRDSLIEREIAALGPLVFHPYSSEERRALILRAEQARLSPWPGVIAGASLAAFGVLLLAIRRPQVRRDG